MSDSIISQRLSLTLIAKRFVATKLRRLLEDQLQELSCRVEELENFRRTKTSHFEIGTME